MVRLEADLENKSRFEVEVVGPVEVLVEGDSDYE